MKRKEIQNLARKIALAEQIIQTSTDPVEIAQAKDEIIKLSSSVRSMEDMMAIDEAVQEILS